MDKNWINKIFKYIQDISDKTIEELMSDKDVSNRLLIINDKFLQMIDENKLKKIQNLIETEEKKLENKEKKLGSNKISELLEICRNISFDTFEKKGGSKTSKKRSKKSSKKRSKKSYKKRKLIGGQEETCAICLENMQVDTGFNFFGEPRTYLQLNSCRHFFHKTCIYEWDRRGGREGNMCPVCRIPIVFKKPDELAWIRTLMFILIVCFMFEKLGLYSLGNTPLSSNPNNSLDDDATAAVTAIMELD